MKRNWYWLLLISPWSLIHSIRPSVGYRLKSYGLMIFCYLFSVTAFSQVINRAEYFIDTDPGNGNGTPVTVSSPSASVNFDFTVPTSSLSVGFHVLGFRIRQSTNGAWSHPQYNAFYIVPPVTQPNATSLVAGEYFFDNDPGFGNGTSFPFTSSGNVTVTLNNVSIGSLAPGFHHIMFRFRDNLGNWTHAHAQAFYIIPPITQDPATTLVAAEYFIDTDLGAGNNSKLLPFTSGTPQNNTFSVSLPGTLTPGFHQIGFRYRDDKGRWSHASTQSFYILPPLGVSNREIVAAEYYLDDPLGTGTPTPIPGIIPGATIDQLVALDMTGVPTGNHTLTIRIKDSEGMWSYLATENFTVSACTPPSPPAAPGVSRCNAGTVTLTATGATGAQLYRWYDDPILNNLLFTGPSFTTPSLTASRNYYVSIFDPGTNCESSRITVAATVTNIAKPVINPSGTLSICEGSALFLSAPTGFAQYIWTKNGNVLSDATQQILATQSGSYTVKVGDGTCQSEVSDAFTLTVIPAPAKPVITFTGSTTICGTGSVDLTGPVGFDYVWSNGATTQTITVSQTGVFFLIVKTAGANCPSLPSDPVVVTVLTPPCGGGNPTNAPPVINSTPLASQIEGKVAVDLNQLVSDPNNNLDFSTLRVINNVTSRGIPATIDASYFLQIDYNGNPFTGTDRITLEVCDLDGLCVQQVIDIEVVGSVVVYNGLTPNGDGYNDFLFIKYIDILEGASQNRVMILNRWGDVVFDIKNYNNIDRVFTGLNKTGAELPSGTYFYKIELSGSKPLTGFITLMR